MIAAIKEMADINNDDADLITAEFLEACHLIFEKGILSHDIIVSTSSPCLANISEGMKWFLKWKASLQEDPGCSLIVIL